MNRTLAFLETLGRDARLAQSSATELASAARAAGVEPDLAEALARGDQVAFKTLLSALLLSLGLAMPSPGYAMIFAPSEEPDTSAPELEEEEPRADQQNASAPSTDGAPADPPKPDTSEPASQPAGEPADAGSGEADAAAETQVDGDVSGDAGTDTAEGESGESGDGAADMESLDEAADEAEDDSSEDDDSAEDEEDEEDF